jgi:hypothetical protein
MDQRQRYRYTLLQAAATVGGPARLARFLDVPEARLAKWIAGEELAPLEAFMNALDLVADGPYAPLEPPVRVAVIGERT